MQCETSKRFEYRISLTSRQQTILEEWEREQDRKVSKMQGKTFPNYGASGGGYSWIITPSTIGTTVQAENSITRERIDLTDYSTW